MIGVGLSPIDYRIIKYISKFDKIHIDDILKKFPDKKFSTKRRLNNLSTSYNLVSLEEILDNNAAHIEFPLCELFHSKLKSGNPGLTALELFIVTDYGKEILSNYEVDLKSKNRETFFKIFPILISLIALLKSFDNELISIWQWLMQLLK